MFQLYHGESKLHCDENLILKNPSHYINHRRTINTRVKYSLLTILQNLCQLLSAHLPVLPSLEIVHTKSSVRYREQLLRHGRGQQHL